VIKGTATQAVGW